MTRLLATLFVLLLALGNTYCLWVYGLGAQVRSWPWFLGCGLCGAVLLRSLWEKVEKSK